MPLTTKSKVKEYARIASADTTKDSFIEQSILWTTSKMSEYCGWSLVDIEVIKEVDGSNSELMFFNEYLVNSITKLEIRTTPSASWTTVNSTDYHLIFTKGLYAIYKESLFDEGLANYKVTYQAGFQDGSIPAILEEIATEMCAMVLKEADIANNAGALGKSSFTQHIDGDILNTSFENLWKTKWSKHLSRYKIWTS